MEPANVVVLEEMRRLFPADAAWKELEIPEVELVVAGEPWNAGSSGALVRPYWYGAEPCHVAVKLYPNSQHQAMRAEFGKANLLRFPSLPRLLGWARMTDGFGIVLEVYGTTLRERLALEALFEEKVRWARQVAAALRFLHGRVYPITHGDVYVSNVLLSNKNAILCDFDRASMDGAHAPEFARFSWFPRFPQRFHLEDRKRLDWFQFGLFLLSLVSDGKWDWREKRELITAKLTRSDFAHLMG